LENDEIEDVQAAGDEFDELTADDLMNLKSKAPQSVRKTGKYYMNETIMNIVRVLKDKNDRYIFQEPSATGPATIWGRPVVEVEVMPDTADTAPETPFVLFGDLKKACILGEKGGLVVDMFDAGVVMNVANSADINLITTDRKAIRMKERTGYICILPGAVKRLVTAATES
jgi:HK97 family phage major capsid protein